MQFTGRIPFACFFACHLVLMIGVNILSIADGIQAVYGYRFLPVSMARTIHGVLDHAVVRQYTMLAGIRMGYNFYAPQVGSPYTVMIERYRGQGMRDTLFHPGLASISGQLRFSSFLDIFQELESGSGRFEEWQAEAVLEQLALRSKPRLGADSLVIRVYRIQPPALRQSTKGTALRLVYPVPESAEP